MRWRAWAIGLAVVLGLAGGAPVEAQRSGGGGGNWELLGEQRVGFDNDRDVIRIGRSEDYFRSRAYRRLRFLTEGGEVRMKDIRLVYINGHTEDIDISRTLRPGENFDLDLRGERSYLSEIIMHYGGKFGLSFGGGGLRVNMPSVKVFGDNIRGSAPAPRPSAGAPEGWFEIAREGFDRRDGRVTIRVGRREGRIGQIRLQNNGDRITVQEMNIRFGNGETQRERLDQRLEGGGTTRPIDVDGDRRFIEQITLRLEPGRRPGQAELIVLGTERLGREGGHAGGGGGGRRDWVLLGEQTVGFRNNRDVIRIGHSEDWYRDRGFDKLRFVAERNDVDMRSIRIVYINGHIENLAIGRLVRPGQDLAVDLPGRRSYIREIEMNYQSRPNFSGRAVIKVYGEAAERR